MGAGCFVSTGRWLDAAVERVKLAEELGYEAVYVTHIFGREPFIDLAAYALATQRIRIGTGGTPIYTRTPANMAQTAITLDELSGGGVEPRPWPFAPALRRGLVRQQGPTARAPN